MVHEQDGPDPTPETGMQAAAARDWEQGLSWLRICIRKSGGYRLVTEYMDIVAVSLKQL